MGHGAHLRSRSRALNIRRQITTCKEKFPRMKKFFATFGARLEYALSVRGIDKFELARMVGANHRSTLNWLKSESAPRGSYPSRIAKVLGLKLSWLMDGVGDPPEPGNLGLVRESTSPYVSDNSAVTVDALLLGQAATVLTKALNRLQISMDEIRLGQALAQMIKRSQATGENPTEPQAIEAILYP